MNKHICSILFPIFSSSQIKALETAGKYAIRFHTKLNVLSFSLSASELQKVETTLISMLNGRDNFTIIESKGGLTENVSRVIDETCADLLLISAVREPGSDALFDKSVIELIELISIPALILPPDFLPQDEWISILVPMSGEVRNSQSLELAIQLAEAADLNIDIIHVSEPDSVRQSRSSIIDHFSDQPHHELPRMLEEFIAEAIPFATHQQKRHIHGFKITEGDVKSEIIHHYRQQRSGMLAVEWNGKFAAGHAKVLKAILQENLAPILLSKSSKKKPPFLRVGVPLRKHG